jgi:lipopolysaccharide export LptBFGC system permease protein LptF
MEITEKSFKCHWKGRRREDQGNLVLENFYVLKRDPGGNRERDYQAEFAKPVLNQRTGELTLHLTNCKFTTDLGVQRSSYLRVNLDLSRLVETSRPEKKDKELSFEELITRMYRREGARARECEAELWSRVALALSSLVFSVFGAVLGIRLKLANRTTVFLIGFVAMAAVYYPLLRVGTTLTKDGRFPAPFAMSLGNGFILLLAVLLMRRLFKT